MELLYVTEHWTCFNYDDNGRPAAECVSLTAAESYVTEIIEPEILLVLDGRIRVSFEKVQNETMAAGQMALLPPCSRVSMTSEHTAQILTFRLRNNVRLCDRYSLEKLYKEAGDNAAEFENRLNTLTTNERLDEFIGIFRKYMSEGLKCIYFFDIKIKELFFILRAYYTKQELAAFFSPMLSADSDFFYFVLANYAKVHSVKEFAQLAGYSLSGFDKQFRKVFGMSAYQWMKQKRLKSIYHEINCSSKTLYEICEDQGFSSPSQFNDYCKKNFGLSPGKIRRKTSCPAAPVI